MISVEPLLLSIPLPQALPAALDGSLVETLQMPLVRLTAGSAVAYGEAALPDPQALPEVLDFFTDLLTPADPLDYGLLWQRMAWSLRDYRPEPLSDYVAVLSALDMALWDLAGKLLGQPCWRLLGGARTRRVDCYAAGLHAARPELLTREAQLLRERFGSLQLRLTGDRDVDQGAARAVRRGGGETLLLRLDGGGVYGDTTAVRALAGSLEPLEPYWWLDPLPPGDWASWAELCPELPLALAGGRLLTSLQAASQALAAGAVDVLAPDLRRCGGLSAGQRLADMAWMHGAAISFTGAFAPLAQLAAGHLAAAMVHATAIEVEGAATVLAEMLDPGLAFTGGFLLVPDGPGLGCQVREDFISRYQGDWDSS